MEGSLNTWILWTEDACGGFLNNSSSLDCVCQCLCRHHSRYIMSFLGMINWGGGGGGGGLWMLGVIID